MTFHRMGRKVWERTGSKRKAGRLLALLLSAALCVEGMSVTVWAQEVSSISENTANPEGDKIAEGEEPGKPEEDNAEGETAEKPEEDDAEGETPEEPEEDGAGGETPENPEEDDTEGETAEKPEEDDAEGEMSEKPEEDDADGEAPEDDSVSENDTDVVSGNDLPSVSENDLSSVSENSLDAERAAMIEEAQKSFAALVSEKPLMALLYHADSYDVRREADTESGKTDSLEIGQTLYVQGVEITEDDVWYRVQFLQNGAEGTGYVQSYYLAYADEDWLAWEEEYLQPVLEQGLDIYKSTASGMRT